PGDRLQDNQIRWLAYCVQHGMPVRVVDVRWADEALDHAIADPSVGALALTTLNAERTA
ncbi:VRR-NUC domain-containing protein, partial [Paraburkholderia sp. SIMBA_055]